MSQTSPIDGKMEKKYRLKWHSEVLSGQSFIITLIKEVFIFYIAYKTK